MHSLWPRKVLARPADALARPADAFARPADAFAVLRTHSPVLRTGHSSRLDIVPSYAFAVFRRASWHADVPLGTRTCLFGTRAPAATAAPRRPRYEAW